MCVLYPKGMFLIDRKLQALAFFLIQFGTVKLLIGAFGPLIFKVIIDRYVFVAILKLVF